jgi:hypothetical protein
MIQPAYASRSALSRPGRSRGDAARVHRLDRASRDPHRFATKPRAPKATKPAFNEPCQSTNPCVRRQGVQMTPTQIPQLLQPPALHDKTRPGRLRRKGFSDYRFVLPECTAQGLELLVGMLSKERLLPSGRKRYPRSKSYYASEGLELLLGPLGFGRAILGGQRRTDAKST